MAVHWQVETESFGLC